MSQRVRPDAEGPIVRGHVDRVPLRGRDLSFQSLILDLLRFWAGHGCVILQPYDMTYAYAFAQLTAYRAAARRLGLTLV